MKAFFKHPKTGEIEDLSWILEAMSWREIEDRLCILLSKNSKMENSERDGVTIFNWGITSVETCPMAGLCKEGCYTLGGSYLWAAVARAYKIREILTMREDFGEMMLAQIERKLKTARRKGNQLIIRVHDSGDFYSPGYLIKWLEIVSTFPEVHFYAYTKSVSMIRRVRDRYLGGTWPANFRIIFSEGGLEDSKINPTEDRHSRVFESKEALEAAGYVDCSKDDWLAATTGSYCIGLVYHGAKSKAWETAS